MHDASEDGTQQETNAWKGFHHANSLLSILLVVSCNDRERGCGVDSSTDPAHELPQEGKEHEGSCIVIWNEIQEAETQNWDDLNDNSFQYKSSFTYNDENTRYHTSGSPDEVKVLTWEERSNDEGESLDPISRYHFQIIEHQRWVITTTSVSQEESFLMPLNLAVQG